MGSTRLLRTCEKLLPWFGFDPAHCRSYVVEKLRPFHVMNPSPFTP